MADIPPRLMLLLSYIRPPDAEPEARTQMHGVGRGEELSLGNSCWGVTKQDKERDRAGHRCGKIWLLPDARSGFWEGHWRIPAP